ncbi:WD40 repeat domain-containing protein [Hydrogenimonas sp.]
MIIEKRLKLQNAATCIKTVGKETVGIVDADAAVRFFGLNPIRLKDGFKTSIRQNSHLLHGNDLSSNGKFVAFAVEKEGAAVFDASRKRLLHRFKRHGGEVESLRIGDRYNYLATGGQDGKTFLWNLSTGRMVASLPHHSDFVTAIDFSANGQWIATGSFDRRIHVTNLSSLSRTFRLRGHGGAINTIRFIGGHRLIAADKSGGIIVWDYFGEKVIKRLKKMLDEVVALALTPDDRFLFAGDRSGLVSLYDLEKFEMLALRYLSYGKPIRALAYSETGNHLIVGLENGEVTFNSPLKESASMERYVEAGELSEAYRLAKENPLLLYSPAYAKLESLWNKAYERAVELLEKGMKEEAKRVLEPFGVESEKRLLIQQLVHDYQQFEKFRMAVENRKYQLAYSLAAQYPILKENRYYHRMESEWNRVFSKAKRVILQNGGDERVRELFKPFRGISSKSVLMQTLLAEKEIYKLFMKLVAKRDYKSAIEISKRYPAIRELEEYRKIEHIAEAIAQKARMELEAGNYAETARLASRLTEFPDHREAAEELMEEANLYASAMRHFAEKNYEAIYRMLERFPVLEETQIVKQLEEAWRKVVERAESLAAQGDVPGLKKIFAPFLHMSQKRSKIVSLFKQAYLERIERLSKESATETGRAIENYLEIFGLDDEIGSWFDLHGLGKEYEGRELPPVDMESIVPVDLPDDILKPEGEKE